MRVGNESKSIKVKSVARCQTFWLFWDFRLGLQIPECLWRKRDKDRNYEISKISFCITRELFRFITLKSSFHDFLIKPKMMEKFFSERWKFSFEDARSLRNVSEWENKSFTFAEHKRQSDWKILAKSQTSFCFLFPLGLLRTQIRFKRALCFSWALLYR